MSEIDHTKKLLIRTTKKEKKQIADALRDYKKRQKTLLKGGVKF